MIDDWDNAACALRVLAHHPEGLGGLVIRMRACPDRDRLLDFAKHLIPDIVRVSPGVDDLHLFGGVDVAATLSAGRVIRTAGLLTGPRVLLLTMAERTPPDLAAKLCQYIDANPRATLIALDEGAEPEERLPEMLGERLAFHVSPEGHFPDGLQHADLAAPGQNTSLDAASLSALTVAATQFGIDSLRAPLMAARVAGSLASLAHRDSTTDDDLAQAASLVLAHRATRMPPPEELENSDDVPPPPPSESAEDSLGDDQAELPVSQNMLIEAVIANLPPEILAGMGRKTSLRGSHGNGAGQKRLGNRRGRPLPARPGHLDGRRRLDILATLRAAAPWQPIRRQQTPDRDGLLLRQSDFRVKRYETKSDRLVIFAVDASGSAAISRLNEAKGAIELLLGQAYSARDHVALVSFRGETAECLLPPTRSLVQTKRKLGALPGGGGTPLAAGLQESMLIAMQAKSKGMSPVIVLLTDGKGNIALDGMADRNRAQEDALQVAKQMRLQGLDVLVIDMSVRPQPILRNLAQHLDSDYLPLPRADARKLSHAVQTVMDDA